MEDDGEQPAWEKVYFLNRRSDLKGKYNGR